MRKDQDKRFELKDELLAKPRASRDFNFMEGHVRAFGRLQIWSWRCSFSDHDDSEDDNGNKD